MRWIGIHEIGVIPSGDVVHELWLNPFIFVDVVDPHIGSHIEDTPTAVDCNTIRLAASWIRQHLSGVTRPRSGSLSIGLLFLPLIGLKVDDKDIIEDLSLETNTTDSTENQHAVTNSCGGVMRTGIGSTDFGFGVFGFTTSFLVGGLLPDPGVTNFEEITVVKSLGGGEHTSEIIDHFTILVSNGAVRVVAPLKRTFILGDHFLPRRGLALEMKQVNFILGDGGVSFFIEAHTSEHNVGGFVLDRSEGVSRTSLGNLFSFLFKFFPN
jgi:hypothetical protein